MVEVKVETKKDPNIKHSSKESNDKKSSGTNDVHEKIGKENIFEKHNPSPKNAWKKTGSDHGMLYICLIDIKPIYKMFSANN